RPTSVRPEARDLALREAAEIDDHVPDFLGGQLALERLHLRLGAGAIADDGEDFAVSRTVRPYPVCQIGRVGVLGSRRAVALGILAVAGGAVFLKRLLAGLDRLGSDGHRILQLPGFGIPARGVSTALRARDHRDE